MSYRSGGTRGGADQFRWEDVKNDKYRESYLGHSLYAPVGRWQNGKDLTWYAKKKGNDKVEHSVNEEIALVRQQDEDLLRQALGQAPIKRLNEPEKLKESELKQILAKGTSERDDINIERVSGLGAEPFKSHEHLKKSLLEREMERRANAQSEGEISESVLVKLVDKNEKFRKDSDILESQKKNSTKKRKREKKEKKEKKKHKHEKKRKKEHRHKSAQRSNSSSDSSG